MKQLRGLAALTILLSLYTFAQTAPTLHGVITDPSGASVPGALVQLRSPGIDQRATTDDSGKYAFAAVKPGKYTIRFIAKGFTLMERKGVEIDRPMSLDVQLTIQAESQVVNVEAEANNVSTDTADNGDALVLGEKELAALSDDPDELSQQLQALAGPGGGPDGAQIYIDGFTGANLPPKASIREVRINSNPYAPEFDRPGFGRIQIFTKPGSDTLRGQVFMQYNKEALNSRSPLLTQSKRPPYQQRFFGLSISGPVKKSKASFGFDAEHRTINENAFILATALDSNLEPVTINQAILTPQTRTNLSPRLDYSINANNTLTVRYQNTRVGLDKEGVGGFSLPDQAYNETSSENTVQVTETAVLSARAINETRFQYMRSALNNMADNSTPALVVQGAFQSGGPQIGNSSTITNNWELTNTSTYTKGAHVFKWGARVRQSFLADTSVNNFGGTYTFFGGVGPELDANNQPVDGTSQELTALEVYQRTLLFQQAGWSAAAIRAAGGGASLFSLNAGIPKTLVNQLDAGLFVNDDWRVRPNLTFSYGLRYEAQTNIGDHGDFAPRVAMAWGVDGGANKTAKTVLRAGVGVFYDRFAVANTLSALRYNGLTQQSYLIVNPDFFPAIPSLSSLAGSAQPQELQLIYAGLKAPRNYQASVGLDRQINRHFRINATYVASRGVHLVRSVDINAPIDGVYPYGESGQRLLTESVGFSRSNMLFVSPNLNVGKIFLFGFYGLSYGMDDNEGAPADPYNLRAEWGPSSFGDIRHRLLLGSSLPLPLKFTISPFFLVQSGTPYNITTGIDSNGDGFAEERPALETAVNAGACGGSGLYYASGFGCFNLQPAAGTAVIGRNYARGPSMVNLGLRLARTWSFGGSGESGPAGGMMGPPPGGGGVRGGGGPPPGGGPPGGGPPPGMFGAATGHKYNLTLSVNARNALNHPNYAAPDGDLTSPYFGEYRSLAGFGPFGSPSTYNRKIDLQLRFTF
ncbi:MAG TPA: carboxypeptidase regulatory-like domain-containing protein [Bryobacteraceae bacterium]|nr:carboxypeptidase regulatory-like domain-containing protein [Bryobacteraceae bacterium]